MACRGVHFSLSADEVQQLRGCASDAERLEMLQEEIEEKYFSEEPERKVETDKAWDAIHRALTDGELSYDSGPFPLSHVILGGELLYNQDDYIMSLKSPKEVAAIAAALSDLKMESFVKGYDRINSESYGMPLSEEDREYAVENFKDLVDFYRKAAGEDRYVLFSVDQ